MIGIDGSVSRDESLVSVLGGFVVPGKIFVLPG